MERSIESKKVTAKEFDRACDQASNARASLVSCCGETEIETNTKMVFQALTRMVNIELVRKNAQRLEWRNRMIEHCHSTVMSRNNWTFEEMVEQARNHRAALIKAGHYD